MKPKTDRKRLIDRLDALWSRSVKERDFYRCQYCFRSGSQAHHIVGRRNHSTRWIMANGITLCPECHAWVHANPEEFKVDMMRKNGNAYHELYSLSKVVVQYRNPELLEILERLKSGG